MTYNRDLQEDKERLFDTVDTVITTVQITTRMLGGVTVNRAACVAAASDPALLATDLADYLVMKGVPFRHAHGTVGSAVALAEKSGRALNQLSLAEFQSLDKHFDQDALAIFDLGRAMERRNMIGAPGTREVAKQLTRWRRLLG